MYIMYVYTQGTYIYTGRIGGFQPYPFCADTIKKTAVI